MAGDGRAGTPGATLDPLDRPDHDRSPRQAGGGISLQTLVIASAAAAAASYVVSRVWEPGTLISAAATPVLVALVSEFLRKPVQTVSATAKRVPVVQQVTIVRERATPPVDPGVTAVMEAAADPPPPQSLRVRWGVIAATAAAAFVIVVGLFTVPDLIAGKSITGNGRGTTYFGGSSGSPSQSQSPKTTTTVTTTAPGIVTTTAPAPTTTVPAPTTTTVPTSTTPAATPTATATAPAPATTTAPPPTTATTPAPAVPIVP